MHSRWSQKNFGSGKCIVKFRPSPAFSDIESFSLLDWYEVIRPETSEYTDSIEPEAGKLETARPTRSALLVRGWESELG